MGVDAYIEDERGNEKAQLLDPGNLVAQLCDAMDTQSTCCLQFIDRYGDTTFNHLQLPFFVSEIQQAIDHSSGSVKAHGVALLELAAKAQLEVHTYLKFYGD